MSKWVNKGTKIITTDSGTEYRIKKIIDGQVQAVAEVPLNLVSFQLGLEGEEDRTTAAKERLLEDPGAAVAGMNYANMLQETVVTLGLVSPNIVPVSVPINELGEDDAHLSFIADDFAELHNAILEFSNSKFERVEVADLQRFREQTEGEASSTVVLDSEGTINTTVDAVPDDPN